MTAFIKLAALGTALCAVIALCLGQAGAPAWVAISAGPVVMLSVVLYATGFRFSRRPRTFRLPDGTLYIPPQEKR